MTLTYHATSGNRGRIIVFEQNNRIAISVKWAKAQTLEEAGEADQFIRHWLGVDAQRICFVDHGSAKAAGRLSRVERFLVERLDEGKDFS